MARAMGLRAAVAKRPGELEPAFEKALVSGTAYLVDVRCNKRFATPVAPYAQAKAVWHDD